MIPPSYLYPWIDTDPAPAPRSLVRSRRFRAVPGLVWGLAAGLVAGVLAAFGPGLAPGAVAAVAGLMAGPA